MKSLIDFNTPPNSIPAAIGALISGFAVFFVVSMVGIFAVQGLVSFIAWENFFELPSTMGFRVISLFCFLMGLWFATDVYRGKV